MCVLGDNQIHLGRDIPEIQILGFGITATKLDYVNSITLVGIIGITGLGNRLGPASKQRANLVDCVAAVVQILKGIVAIRVGMGHAAVAQPDLPTFQGGLIAVPNTVPVDVLELVTIQAAQLALC